MTAKIAVICNKMLALLPAPSDAIPELPDPGVGVAVAVVATVSRVGVKLVLSVTILICVAIWVMTFSNA